MTETGLDRRRTVLTERIAADVKRMRDLAGLSREELSGGMGRKRNWLADIETCRDKIALTDYLMIMNFLREMDPEHPAAALYDHYVRGPGNRLRLVK